MKILIASMFFYFVAPLGNVTNVSFPRAKGILHYKVYKDHRTTFYCGCKYDEDKNVNYKDGCSFKSRYERGNRIEWEHVVPASLFGQRFIEWKEGARHCVTRAGKPYKGRRCASSNKKYAYMQADMYNLYPAIGELNGRRSNYAMSEIEGEERRFGTCDVEIQNRQFEPRPEVRGDIARTYLYMNIVYPGFGIVNDDNVDMFQRWDLEDPVSPWECKRNEIIASIQKNVNRITKSRCDKIKDI